MRKRGTVGNTHPETSSRTRETVHDEFQTGPMKHTTSSEKSWAGWQIPGVGRVSVDVPLGICALVLLDAAVLALPVGNIPRILLALPLAFFLPGYALLLLLFPGKNRPANTTPARSSISRHGIDLSERLALSIATSAGLLPILVVVLSLFGIGLVRVPFVAALSLITVAGFVGGAVRQRNLPESDQYHLPVDRWIDDTRHGLSGSPLDVALNVLLVVAVTTTLLGVGYTVVATNGADEYSTVSLLTADEGGDYVASGYPETIPADGTSLVVGIENHEGKTTDYTVVGQLQRVRTGEGSVTVLERREVSRMTPTVAPDETWYGNHEVSPALQGSDLRLVYYVYTDEPPAEPSRSTADEYVHIWVDVPQSS